MNRTCFAFESPLMVAALLATISVAIALPTTADAQIGTLYRSSADVYGCAQFEACEVPGDPCDGGRTCAALPNGGQGCVFTDGTYIYELLCCQSSDDCGSLNGVSGICTEGLNDSDEGVCIYEPRDLFCEDPASVGLSELEECMTETVSGDIYSDFVNGNCDGDALPNHVDPCHCDPDDLCVPDEPDAGAPYPSDPEISFTGKGGCTATPFAPTSPLLYLLALPLLLLRRKSSLSRSLPRRGSPRRKPLPEGLTLRRAPPSRRGSLSRL